MFQYGQSRIESISTAYGRKKEKFSRGPDFQESKENDDFIILYFGDNYREYETIISKKGFDKMIIERTSII